MTVVWIGQSHDVSSRTPTSAILQIGHEPGFDSTMSGCMGQVMDTGGRDRGADLVRSACELVPPRCAETPTAMPRINTATPGPMIRVNCTADR